jgi:hypothetical protein
MIRRKSTWLLVAAGVACVGCSRLDESRQLGTLRSLGHATTVQGITVSVKTKWRDDRVWYLISMEPEVSVRKLLETHANDRGAARGRQLVPYALAIELQDADGFTIESIPVTKADVIDELGKGYTLMGSRPLSAGSFKSVSRWSPIVSWGWREDVERPDKP